MITKLAIFEGTVKPGQTTAMRAYVEIDPFVELRGVEAMLRLKRDFEGLVDLQSPEGG